MESLEPIEDGGPEVSGESGDGPIELSRTQLEGLRRRDPDALAAFFDAYFERVYGYVRRLTGEEHLAEDLTQDVFLQLYRSFDSYDPERELRPWVFAVATNKVRDHWRSRAHREAQRAESVERDGAGRDVVAADGAPGSGLDRQELAEHLRAAIDTLPEGLRMTVLLRVYEALSFQAIGEILECNEATARKRYSRGIEKLRGVVGTDLVGGAGGAGGTGVGTPGSEARG